MESGALKNVEQHSKQGLYTPVAVAADKVVAAQPEKDAGKGKTQAKKPAKDAKWLMWKLFLIDTFCFVFNKRKDAINKSICWW